MMFAQEAVNFCKSLDIETILDVGCGDGSHSEAFKQLGKSVTSVDISGLYPPAIQKDFILFDQDQKFDLIWLSHVLEHQPNPNFFLKKCRQHTYLDKYICVTVPPLKHEIVGGHVTLWNAGLVMYNLVLAGYNCRKAHIKQYDYNISVIAKADNFILPELTYDWGDIERIAEWLPPGYNYQGFNGNIQEHNWK
jgi:SAM-dependent methyltransferase